SFVVSLLPQEPAALLAASDGPEEVSRWRMFTLDLHPQYAAALAVEDRDGRVCLRQEVLAA
ncbi:MAG: phosphopantetheinyl transferase, partial [Bryobacteraceae bacterium]